MGAHKRVLNISSAKAALTVAEQAQRLAAVVAKECVNHLWAKKSKGAEESEFQSLNFGNEIAAPDESNLSGKKLVVWEAAEPVDGIVFEYNCSSVYFTALCCGALACPARSWPVAWL